MDFWVHFLMHQSIYNPLHGPLLHIYGHFKSLPENRPVICISIYINTSKRSGCFKVSFLIWITPNRVNCVNDPFYFHMEFIAYSKNNQTIVMWPGKPGWYALCASVNAIHSQCLDNLQFSQNTQNLKFSNILVWFRNDQPCFV